MATVRCSVCGWNIPEGAPCPYCSKQASQAAFEQISAPPQKFPWVKAILGTLFLACGGGWAYYQYRYRPAPEAVLPPPPSQAPAASPAPVDPLPGVLAKLREYGRAQRLYWEEDRGGKGRYAESFASLGFDPGSDGFYDFEPIAADENGGPLDLHLRCGLAANPRDPQPSSTVYLILVEAETRLWKADYASVARRVTSWPTAAELAKFQPVDE